MKIQKNFTTGILTGICGVLLLFVLSGTTSRENTNTTPIYEFHDMKDTRGLIFNKVTGEYTYEEIREKPVFVEHYHNLSSWNGQNPGSGSKVKHITP